MDILIDDACTACERCVELCPKRVYVINPNTNKADPVRKDWCTHCFVCASNCPVDAIKIILTKKIQ